MGKQAADGYPMAWGIKIKGIEGRKRAVWYGGHDGIAINRIHASTWTHRAAADKARAELQGLNPQYVFTVARFARPPRD